MQDENKIKNQLDAFVQRRPLCFHEQIAEHAPPPLTCSEIRRTDSSVTWGLHEGGRLCGYVRFEAPDNLLFVRVFWFREPWSDQRASDLEHLPQPLVGRFEVRRSNDELIGRLSYATSAHGNALACLSYFFRVRGTPLEDPLFGDDALADLAAELGSLGLPAVKVARDIPGLVKLGPRRWATCAIPQYHKSEDVIPQPIEDDLLNVWDQRPFFALSQQLHGTRTYLNLACSLGEHAVAVDVQVSWDEGRSDEQLYPPETVRILTDLFTAVDDFDGDADRGPFRLAYSSGYSLDARIWSLGPDQISGMMSADDAEQDFAGFFEEAVDFIP